MTFTPDVYEQIRAGAQRSAARIVPLVRDLVRPESVVDVGCGEGWFARRFAEEGVPEVLGLDESVSGLGTEEMLDNDSVLWFRRASLPDGLARLERRFDLAVCLEVGEHLPEAASEALVASLTACAPVVLWSAAIPGQSGHGHVNCAWPQTWCDLFAERRYFASEDLRWAIWDDEEVEPWYRQNLLLYASDEARSRLVGARVGDRLAGASFTRRPRAVVHPGIWVWKLG